MVGRAARRVETQARVGCGLRRSGMRSLSGAKSSERVAPRVGREVIDPRVRPGVDVLDDAGQVGSGIDASGLCAGDEGQHIREPFGAILGTGEEPRFAPRGDAAQPSFDTAVVDLHAPVDGEGDGELPQLINKINNTILHGFGEGERQELGPALEHLGHDGQALAVSQVEPFGCGEVVLTRALLRCGTPREIAPRSGQRVLASVDEGSPRVHRTAGGGIDRSPSLDEACVHSAIGVATYEPPIDRALARRGARISWAVGRGATKASKLSRPRRGIASSPRVRALRRPGGLPLGEGARRRV